MEMPAGADMSEGFGVRFCLGLCRRSSAADCGAWAHLQAEALAECCWVSWIVR